MEQIIDNNLTKCYPTKRSSVFCLFAWWAVEDLNLWPPACKAYCPKRCGTGT